MTGYIDGGLDVERALSAVKARGRTQRRVRRMATAVAPVIALVLVAFVVLAGHALSRSTGKSTASTVDTTSGSWHVNLRGEFHTVERTDGGVDVTGRWSLALTTTAGTLTPPRSALGSVLFRRVAGRTRLWRVTGPHSSCSSTEGLYRLSAAGDRLWLTVVNDRCLLRTQLLSLHAYSRG